MMTDIFLIDRADISEKSRVIYPFNNEDYWEFLPKIVVLSAGYMRSETTGSTKVS